MLVDPRHGAVHELTGAPVKSGEWSFVPALVSLAGSYGSGPRLEPLLADVRPAVLLQLPERGMTAIWARARIEALFGVSSRAADDRAEKTLMEFGFVAQREHPDAAIPFFCTDYYGKASVDFAEAVPTADVDAIANAFWGLVASGDDLVEYRDRALHLGACKWMDYGYERGELYLRYSDED